MTSTLDFPVTPATASDGYAEAELGFAPLAPRTRSHHGIAPTPRRVSAAVQPDLGLHPADPMPVQGGVTAASAGQGERGLVPAAPPAAFGLLAQAEQGLTAAVRQPQPAQRFAEAYLCALRAAAALLAARGRPHRGRAKPTSVWTLLSSVAPEMREWAAFFASCSTTRAAVQAGITSRVGPRAADDLVRQSGQFIALVHRAVHGDRR